MKVNRGAVNTGNSPLQAWNWNWELECPGMKPGTAVGPGTALEVTSKAFMRLAYSLGSEEMFRNQVRKTVSDAM